MIQDYLPLKVPERKYDGCKLVRKTSLGLNTQDMTGKYHLSLHCNEILLFTKILLYYSGFCI